MVYFRAVNDKYGYWPFALAGGVILGTAGLLIFKMILTATPD
jgi:hypothetical protein